jgi:hypothetical protein
LESSELIETVVDEYDHVYVLRRPGDLRGDGSSYNYWIAAADFLYSGHGLEISDWVRTLDFSVFDRPAPKDRPVPWR